MSSSFLAPVPESVSEALEGDPQDDQTVTATETTTPIERETNVPVASVSWLAGLGTTVGLVGLLASSCCVIPMALAGIGAGGAAFSGLEFLARWQPFLIGAAALSLAVGWAMYFRQRFMRRNECTPCAKPSRWVATLLMLGTVFVALSYVWEPYIETMLIRFVR
jgi:mercuric ion transport protein